MLWCLIRKLCLIQGFYASEYELAEVFDYMLSTSIKYERLRKNAFLRMLLGIVSRVHQWRKR